MIGSQLTGHGSLDEEDDASFAAVSTTPDCPLPGQLNYANHLPGSCKHLIFVKYYLEENVENTLTVWKWKIDLETELC